MLDEPTTGLDVTTQARISDLIRRIVADTRVAALYVSHDLALLSVLAHRLTVMYAGQVVESGPLDTLRTSTRHPYTQALLAALPSAHDPHEIAGIPGEPPPHVVLEHCAFAPRCRYAIDACRAAPVPLTLVAPSHEVRCIRAEDAEVIATAPRPLRPAPPLTVASAPENALLAVDHVSCGYGESFTAVRDVSFHVLPGETLGLVGESGSGKSTMLRAIAGIHAQVSGSLRFRGEELERTATKRPPGVRQEIQIVFQDPGSSLNPRQTVEQLVSRPLRLFRDDIARSQERETVVALLESVKLSRVLLARYPWELSGGQKQRVALARAFAARPTLLLCDEVTSALDVSVQATVLDLILELSRQSDTAVVFVSHDLAVVRTVASRALVMRNGEICEQGPVEKLFAAPRASVHRRAARGDSRLRRAPGCGDPMTRDPLEWLVPLVAIPSISADPAHARRRACERPSSSPTSAGRAASATRSCSRLRAPIRRSTRSGSTPRAGRRSSCTGTTTCSR